jgi:hypothetical protein
MTFFFTTCFIHELPQIASLSSRFDKIIVGIVDIETKNIHPIANTELLFLDQIRLTYLNELSAKYSTEELRAIAKVLFGKYLYEGLSDNDFLVYITPLFYLTDTTRLQTDTHDIFLLPKTTQPFEIKDEKTILNSGMFESDFWAVRKSKNATQFLNWWEEKVIKQGYIKPCEGLNADELWLNHVPVFFKNVKIIRDNYWITKNISKTKKYTSTVSSLGIYTPTKPLMWLRKPLVNALLAMSTGVDSFLKLLYSVVYRGRS